MPRTAYAASSSELKYFEGRPVIERIERLEEEKAALAADIREIYAEAKGVGFDPKIMRQVIKLRKLDTAELQEQDALLDTYKHALGME